TFHFGSCSCPLVFWTQCERSLPSKSTIASEGGVSVNGCPGATLRARGRFISCTFHFWSGSCGVSLYPRTSSPADAGIWLPPFFGAAGGAPCCAATTRAVAKTIKLFIRPPEKCSER